MVEDPHKDRDDAAEVARSARGVARDDRDVRTDALSLRLLEMVEDLQKKVLVHMDTENATIHEIKSDSIRLEGKIDTLLSAFSDNDPVAHRKYHDLQLEVLGERKEFFKKLRSDLIRLGLLGFLGWALYALWKAFLIGPK